MSTILPSCDTASVQMPGEKEQETFLSGLLTSYIPVVQNTKREGELLHPGIGLTREVLGNIQKQVRRGTEPWRTYFADMLQSGAASATPDICLSDPSDTHFNSQQVNGWFIRDALTAYTQALLYFVTGRNRYRKNALHILRTWSRLDPGGYAYFTDACIHVGIPMYRMCAGAEIIRYSTYRVTEGYEEPDLDWTSQEIADFADHLVRPAIRTFLSSCDAFMNQHLYTVIGAMSGYVFLDDMEGYTETVEWFTVNRSGKNPGYNGSIQRLFRQISTMDEAGAREGDGRTLGKPVIQHVEMGRDQAHGCGDLTNAAILARILLGQGTRVDPAEGTASGRNDAVGIYEFLDHRILKAADYFVRYMLGYDTDWVPVAYSIQDEKIVDMYRAISPNYRGRFNTMQFWEIFIYYVCSHPEIDLEKQYPYFYEGFLKKLPSNYYTKGRMEIGWDNRDGGGDFWLFIPGCLAWDTRFLARSQTDYCIRVPDRGVMVENREAMSCCVDGRTGYIRFAKSPRRSRLAIVTGGTDGQTIAFRIRTDGVASLSLENGVEGSLYLPDTGGAWEYVTFTRKPWEAFGDLYDVILSGIQGKYVDIDSIDIKPETGNADRREIAILAFAAGDGDISHVTYLHAPVELRVTARDTTGERAVIYEGKGLPEGVSLNRQTGILRWTPERTGRFSCYVCARSDGTSIVKRVEIEVAENREEAVKRVMSQVEGQEYTSVTWGRYKRLLDELKSTGSVSDEIFMARLMELQEAAGCLQQIAPRLERDSLTGGRSLDYPRMVHASTMGREIWHLTDGQGTFCGYYTAPEGVHILDFGPDIEVMAVKFGFQARYGFPDRLAGVQVFGSHDRESWIRLTVREAAFTQAYQELEVREEEKGNKYRYLQIRKTTEYPDTLRGERNCLLEFGELRIFGEGYEKQ